MRKATLSKEDYRTFSLGISKLEQLGYDIPHVVESLGDDKFEVTVHGEHDWEYYDKLIQHNPILRDEIGPKKLVS